VYGNYSANRNNGWEDFNQTNVMQTTTGKVTFDQNAIAKSTKASIRNSIRAGMDYF